MENLGKTKQTSDAVKLEITDKQESMQSTKNIDGLSKLSEPGIDNFRHAGNTI